MLLTIAMLTSVVSFPVDGLQPRIDFWKSVFTQFGGDHLIFHDRNQVHLVYEVVDLKAHGIDREDRKQQQQLEALHRERLARALSSIAGQRPVEWSNYAHSLAKTIAASGVGESPHLLAQRIHVQRGIRENFSEGLRRYDNYRNMVEKILREENVPQDLAALPLVESTYLNAARSRTGAAGIWQFMPNTARQYMTVTAAVDQRLDPLVATRSAARLLRSNYNILGSWPLAISAYNHGPGGIRRARQQCGDSIARIIECYQSPSFGYASMNFYSEFRAALDLLNEHRRKNTPVMVALETGEPIQIATQSYRVRKGDTLIQLSRKFRTSMQQLMTLNQLKDPHRLVAGTMILVPRG